MKINFFTIRSVPRSHKKGSALLIAILVMGILLTMTLGLSDLVIREIRQTTDVVSSGKAYFAAEAGIENGLLDLHTHFPGYETSSLAGVTGPDVPCLGQKGYVPVPTSTVNSVKSFDEKNPPCYRILNKAGDDHNTVPSFDPDKPIFIPGQDVPTNLEFVYTDYPEATFRDLALGESIYIPLFSANNDDDPTAYSDVKEFLVEYYLNFTDDEIAASGIKKDDFGQLDILRWKIFGKSTNGTSKTESVSDFFPADAYASAKEPVCIGNDDTLDPNCKKPLVVTSGDKVLWGAARECYGSDAGLTVGQQVGESNGINNRQEFCTIDSFIKQHTQNYLVLTNAINPDVLLPGYDLKTPAAKQLFKIHYRVVAKPGAASAKLVRDAASISADGYAANGQVKQTIDVQISQSSFLPVFNFSLYQTKTQ